MKIRLAYNFDIEAYKSLFPEIELFNWDKDRDTVIDLLIFPGGEDVSLEYYLPRNEVLRYSGLCHSSRERDDYEMNILDACYDGRITVHKILGICRGMQFINVMFGGKLFPDMYINNIGHDRIHDIKHRTKSKLDFLKTVNSLHHQGLRTLGQHNRIGNGVNPRIIAFDEAEIVPEIVLWGRNDDILGVQFHPEYFWDNNPDKSRFSKVIYNWINGESIL